ncbi:RHS repeat-associated core domain-containing protein [Bailinhaonella thermotolerans]|nr:RHS repeat-associated core domain-containing protein [Bailinhaonella thermotolerans]
MTTNPLGHAQRRELHPAWGLPIAEVDANDPGTAGDDRRTELRYDGLGRLEKVWLPGRALTTAPSREFAYDVRADAASSVTSRILVGEGATSTAFTLYDGFGRERQTQVSAASGTTGRVLTDTLYDSHGNVASRNAPYYDPDTSAGKVLGTPVSDIPSQTVYQYDRAGRRIAEILLSRGAEVRRTTTSYGGNWTAVDPPEGETATQTFTDARGRVTELRQFHGGAPAGSFDATRYEYDEAGRAAKVTDPAGNVWRYGYDLRGRMIRAEQPDRGATTQTYDAVGNLTSRTDARGKTITYAYDALGRKTAAHEGTAKLAEWTYDTLSKGLLTSSTRYTGTGEYTVAVTGYDGRDRLTGQRVTVPASDGFGFTSLTTALTHTEGDKPAQVTLPAVGGLPAETLTHRYTEQGLPLTLTGDLAGGGTAEYGTAEYNELGELAARTHGDPERAVTSSYSYDEATRRLTGAATSHAREDVTNLTYAYDPAGNVTRLADETGEPDVQCLRNDHLRRLAEAWTPADGDCAAEPARAGLGGPAPYWHGFGYDVTGNRRTEVRHESAGDLTATSAHPAPGSARPHAVTSVRRSGPGVDRTDTFAHDAAGNLTSRVVAGKTQTLTWDGEGLLASVADGATTVSYVHDADGARLIRRDASGTTLYAGDTEVTVSGGKVTATRHYRHGDQVIAARTGSGVSWLVSDLNGTAVAAVDADTLAVSRRRHLPSGELRGPAPASWPGQRGFVGGIADPTGLTQLGARAYDPVTGAFASVDPVTDHADPQQVNGYAYANNSPVSFIDADGLRAKKTAKSPKSSIPVKSRSPKSGRSTASASTGSGRSTASASTGSGRSTASAYTGSARSSSKRVSDNVKRSMPGFGQRYDYGGPPGRSAWGAVTRTGSGGSGRGGSVYSYPSYSYSGWDQGWVLDGDYMNHASYDAHWYGGYGEADAGGGDFQDGSAFDTYDAPDAPSTSPCGSWSSCLPAPNNDQAPPFLTGARAGSPDAFHRQVSALKAVPPSRPPVPGPSGLTGLQVYLGSPSGSGT